MSESTESTESTGPTPPINVAALCRFLRGEHRLDLGFFKTPKHKRAHAWELESSVLSPTFWDADAGVPSSAWLCKHAYMHCLCCVRWLALLGSANMHTCTAFAACADSVPFAFVSDTNLSVEAIVKAFTQVFVRTATDDVDVLRQLLFSASPADPNEVNPTGGGTAIQAAITNGSVDCLQMLLSAGADPNGSTRLQHYSALQHAVSIASLVGADEDRYPHRLSIIKMLLVAGANPNVNNNVDTFCVASSNHGLHNPLEAALAFWADPSIVRLLRIFGATLVGDVSAWFDRAHPGSLSAKSDLSCLQLTPFMAAVHYDHLEYGMLALKAGVDAFDPALHEYCDGSGEYDKVCAFCVWMHACSRSTATVYMACMRACIHGVLLIFFGVCV